MPFIQLLLLNIPTVILGIIIVFLYVIVSIIGLYIVRAFHPPQKFKLHNDVAGFIFATLGVIYAVMLAFLVIATWQNYDEAEKNVTREANYIASVYRDTRPLPASFRNELKKDLIDYVNFIINDEWQIMSKGERSQNVQQSQDEIWRLFSSYIPKNETQKIFFAESVRKLNESFEMRRMRLLEANSGIHPILYFVLIIGGIITVSFMLFFGTENFVPQLIMTSMLAAMIAIALFTVIALDYPFIGDISIKADVFRNVLKTLMSSTEAL
ncbi:MAG: hypothetical protein FD159_200 [Syntrophaceae bacterium]|nr:MAG: hypothetical protein FD159_200 [Syntrophaceae bacterium]